jgi:hypothetical protein
VRWGKMPRWATLPVPTTPMRIFDMMNDSLQV